MRLLRTTLLSALSLGALALPASAAVVWRGDFVTGDFSQWQKVEAVQPDRLQVVGDETSPTGFDVRVTVHQGDDPIGASGNRNELSAATHESEGSERYYRWQTFFPSADYKSEDTWQLFTQFHHTGLTGSPPIEFFTRGQQIILRVCGNEVWTTPLVQDQWHEFVLHVKWSSAANQGLVELTYDGQPVLQSLSAATMFPGQGVYMKQGLYRNKIVNHDQVVFHRGLVVGDTLQDVMSPPPANETFANAQ